MIGKMSEIDLTLALQLQAQFEEELRVSLIKQEEQQRKSQALTSSQGTKWNSKGPLEEPSQEKLSVSLIDPSWELIDPNPDIHTLFLTFNNQFFWGRLSTVEVKWSPRMTLCAGVCSYEGRGGLCSVRLSVPLLKLRPRKDLIETLLHEMIHAYLFVTANNRDRDGHGPEFHKHMCRINEVAGTRITVFHSFHDEVDVYRQHIWQCDGPCRTRRPYFGLVKRAMNRAPSPRDPWWQSHQQSCGGTYSKIQEPKGYVDKRKQNLSSDTKKPNNCGDIRKFIEFKGKGNLLDGSASCSSQISRPVPSSKQAIGLKTYSFGETRESQNFEGSDVTEGDENNGEKRKINGLAASLGTGIVKKVSVDNASRSNVHVLGNGSPLKKRPCNGIKGASTGKSSEKIVGKPSGNHGFGTVLTVRGSGSRTMTVKGKNAIKTDAVKTVNQVNNDEEMKDHTLKPPSFQGQGTRLGGLSNGVSRLLSISSSSQPSGFPTSFSETEHFDDVEPMSFERKEKESQDQKSWISRSPSKGKKISPGLQKSLNDYIVSSSKQLDHVGNDFVRCPVCNEAVSQRKINEHLDECLCEFGDDE